MFGVTAEECLHNADKFNQLTQKLKPWLGNFMMDESLHSIDGYREDQYVDMIVQSWEAEDEDENAVIYHSLCNCELTAS